MIKTEDIELVGSIMKEKSMGFTSKGTVRYKDGTFWSFQSPQGKRSNTREKLMDMFEKIAAFYDTKVFSHSFKRGLS